MADYTSFEFKCSSQATLEACDEIGIVVNPDKTEDYATFTSKILAVTSMSSADVSITEEPDGSGKIILNPKSGVDQLLAAADTDDIALFARNTTASRVEFVQDITDRTLVFVAGDKVNIPQAVSYLRDPTPVA